MATQQQRDTPAPDSNAAGDARVVLSWGPWVGILAAVGVYVDDGFGTALGLEPRLFTVGTLALALAAWLTVGLLVERERQPRLFAGVGGAVLAVLLGYALAGAPPAAVGWLALATVLAGTFALYAYRVLARSSLPSGATALGVFLVFAQALDGTTTAVGIDVLGYGEQSPLSASILEFAATLPYTALTGTGWLFVLVKVLLSVAVVGVLAGGTDDRLQTLALGVAAFVGLGPAVHNIVLFTA